MIIHQNLCFRFVHMWIKCTEGEKIFGRQERQTIVRKQKTDVLFDPPESFGFALTSTTTKAKLMISIYHVVGTIIETSKQIKTYYLLLINIFSPIYIYVHFCLQITSPSHNHSNTQHWSTKTCVKR